VVGALGVRRGSVQEGAVGEEVAREAGEGGGGGEEEGWIEEVGVAMEAEVLMDVEVEVEGGAEAELEVGVEAEAGAVTRAGKEAAQAIVSGGRVEAAMKGRQQNRVILRSM
jgi:hypothetical protein